jgi:LuxR family maltose regulon positive regulatory protein
MSKTAKRQKSSRSDRILRYDLIQKMKKIDAKKKNIFIHAPGGYGKTTVARQWLEAVSADAPAILTVSGADNDPGVFYPRLTREIMKLIGANPTEPPEVYDAETLLNTITAFPRTSARRKYILLDDLHVLRNRDVLNILRGYASKLPSYVCVCGVSRAAPSQELVDTGLFSSITKEDLAFSPEEVESLGAANDLTLTKEHVRDMLAVTDGWAIYLSALISDGEWSRIPQTLNQYLKARVWDMWEDGMKNRLLCLSVPSSLTPELCQRLTGVRDGRALLEELTHENNMFLSVNENGIYRFHDLFRDFLTDRLEELCEPGEINRLHNISGDWHYENRLYYEGVKHYITSRNHDGITRCFHSVSRYLSTADGLSAEFHLNLVAQHIDRLPFAFVIENPHLLGSSLVASYFLGDLDSFLRYLDILRGSLPRLAAASPDFVASAMLLFVTDPRVSLREYAESLRRDTAFRIAPQPREAAVMTITQNLPFIHRSVRDFSEYYALNPEDLTVFGEVFGKMVGGMVEVFRHALVAGLLYERGELFEALRAALLAYNQCREDSSPEMVFSAHSLLAFILHAMGARRDADAIMEKLEGYLQGNAHCLLPNFRALQTIRAIAAGNAESAGAWLNVGASRAERPPFYQICRHFATMRALIALGEYSEAIEFGKRLQTLASDYARPLDRMESAILTAIAYSRAGERKKALSQMEKALSVAAPYGYTQQFVNEGEDVLPLVLSLREIGTEPQKAFAETIARRIGLPETGEPALEALSPKRREVLERLGRGLSYNEIAAEMGLTRSTVKRHILLAYDQLGAHDAQQAVARAKILGLIDKA